MVMGIARLCSIRIWAGDVTSTAGAREVGDTLNAATESVIISRTHRRTDRQTQRRV